MYAYVVAKLFNISNKELHIKLAKKCLNFDELGTGVRLLENNPREKELYIALASSQKPITYEFFQLNSPDHYA